jgi:hypothetical protein
VLVTEDSPVTGQSLLIEFSRSACVACRTQVGRQLLDAF